ncbi:MAG: alpha/beta hydrolase [Pirellulaceae bacterium]|nr:alpha/beta hydrolase [Planctomycetales bacterium]
MMVVVVAVRQSVWAAPPAPPLFQQTANEASFPPEIALWPNGAPGAKTLTEPEKSDGRGDGILNRAVSHVAEPTLSIYPAPADIANGAAVVICPGGGYAILAIDKEGHDIARWFNSFGVTACVLKYRLMDFGQPWPKLDVQRAIRTVRQRAESLRVDPQRIGVMGFSAGGHVASTAATHFDNGDANASDPIDRVSCRPDFSILVYPVISMDATISHGGSRKNLLGDDPSDDLVKEYSNELHVNGNTPPTFLVHTLDDGVRVENSVRFFRALLANKVPADVAIYPRGGHGYGLGVNGGEVASWPDRCKRWLAEQGVVGK